MTGSISLTFSNPDHTCKVGECAQGQYNTACLGVGDVSSDYANQLVSA